MEKLIFYTKENCLLCDEAFHLVEMLSYEYPIEIEAIDIYQDDSLLEKYHLEIPVVKIKEQELMAANLTYENLEAFIQKLAMK